MAVILDIGSGYSSKFGKEIYRKNRKNIVFSGEPDFQKFKDITKEGIENLIKNKKIGHYKIKAAYNDIPFPKESLDLVICNFPNLNGLCKAISEFDWLPYELIKVLKKGGFYYQSAAIPVHIETFDGRLKLLEEGKLEFFQKRKIPEVNEIPNPDLDFNIPLSFFGRSTIFGDIMGNVPEAYKGSEYYIYPNYKIYQRIID